MNLFDRVKLHTTPNDSYKEKIISVIEKDFSSLSYKTLSKEIKSLPNDAKRLKLYLISYSKKIEKLITCSVDKIKSIFEQKKKLQLDNFTTFSNLNFIQHKETKLKKKAFDSFKNSYTNLNKSFNNILSHGPSSTHNSFIRKAPFSPQEMDKINFFDSVNNSRNTSNNQRIIKSKSAKKIFTEDHNHSISKEGNINLSFKKEAEEEKKKSSMLISLSKEIVSFIDDMKNLQNSICNKEPNVFQMKKNFEKKKKMLYNEASRNLSPHSIKSSDSKLSQLKQTPIKQRTNSFASNTSTNTVKTCHTTNIPNNNNQVFNESISALKVVIEEIKENNKFITEELRNEIKALNQKLSSQEIQLKQNEIVILNNLSSIKTIYKSLKDFNQVLDSIPIQLTTNESKFEWYEKEILKIISVIPINNTSSNNEQRKVNDAKIIEMIKNTSRTVIEMIRPYIYESETEFDLNTFESKQNLEEGILLTATESLKKYIKTIILLLNESKLKNETLQKNYNDLQLKSEAYKTALENTVVNKMTQQKPSPLKKIEKENHGEQSNFQKLNADLINIQTELLQKLEFKDIEIEKNQETIRSLLQINSEAKNFENAESNENNPDFVSSEKYVYLLNLYSGEQEKSKALQFDYLHLIEDLSEYIVNGKKIALTLSEITKLFSNDGRNDFYFGEELDSNELGRINENDLLTDKENKRVNTKESLGSNCNTYNKYTKTNQMKNEIKKAQSEIERLSKKISEFNNIFSTIANAVKKILFEVQVTSQSKEYFTLVFKLLNYNDKQINELFTEKERLRKIH